MKRIGELDALRGLASLAIVAFHLWFPERAFLGTAVDLFFVLSGYLITTIILRQLDQPGFLVRFYARRALRIWPIYYLSLAVLLVLNPWLPERFPLDGLGYFLTYTQNVPFAWSAPTPAFFGGFTHTWTLALEEQYYIFWPVALIVLGRRALVPLALGLIALSTGARMVGISRFILVTRCDGLALGALVAALFEARESGRVSSRWIGRILLAFLGCVLVYLVGTRVLVFLGKIGPEADGLLVRTSLRMLAINGLYTGLIGLIVLGSGAPWLAPLRDRRLRWFGQLSYGFYLYHFIVLSLVDDYAGRHGLANGWALDAVKVGGTLGLAAASWHLVERPLLAFKGRFEPGSAVAATARMARPAAHPVGSGAQ